MTSRAPYLSLLKALRRGEIRQIASDVLSRRIDFKHLADVLIDERLGVYFYSSVLDLKIQALFPRDFLSQIRNQYDQQHTRNLRLELCLREIGMEFGIQGIDFMLLKGLHVAQLAYNGAGARFTWDLDLLVREESWGAAVGALSGIGFAKPRFAMGLDRIISGFIHGMPMERPGDVSLDLHWTFRKLPGVQIDMAEVWQRGAAYTIGGCEYKVPCNEHLLLLLLLGVADDRNRSKVNIRSLWDVFLILHHVPALNWRSFLAEREREGILPLIVNTLAFAVKELECRDEFPQLVGVLEEWRHLLLQDIATTPACLPRGWHRQLSARWWYVRLQPGPWYYCVWWLVTLPLRFLLTHSR